MPDLGRMTKGGVVVRRRNPNHLKKQSQFGPGHIIINASIERPYANKSTLGVPKNKANGKDRTQNTEYRRQKNWLRGCHISLKNKAKFVLRISYIALRA